MQDLTPFPLQPTHVRFVNEPANVCPIIPLQCKRETILTVIPPWTKEKKVNNSKHCCTGKNKDSLRKN